MGKPATVDVQRGFWEKDAATFDLVRIRSQALLIRKGMTSPSRDSWTDTSFVLDGTQQGPTTPLVDSPYPGNTSTDSAQWLVYLTTHFRSSVLETCVYEKAELYHVHERSVRVAL